MRRMRFRSALAACSAAFTFVAASTTSAASSNIVAPAAAGQQALAVSVREGALVAKVCPSPASCSADAGASIDVPADAASLLKKGARIEAVKLVGGRHVVRVAADGSNNERFTAYLAAPLANKGESPLVLWSGFTGQSKGEYGEERASVISEEKADDGMRIVIGEQRADVTICGRPAVVAARDVGRRQRRRGHAEHQRRRDPPAVGDRARHHVAARAGRLAGRAPVEWGIALKVDEPRALGADRAVNAISAHALEQGDKIVISVNDREVLEYKTELTVGEKAGVLINLYGGKGSVDEIEAKALRKLKHPSRSRKLRSFLDQ